MSEIEITGCDVCGNVSQVQRKYYHYDIKCDCCMGDQHFAIVRHCEGCVPRAPTKVQIILDDVVAVDA